MAGEGEAGCVHMLGSLSWAVYGVVRGAGLDHSDVFTDVVAVDLLLSTGTAYRRRKIPRPRHSIALGSDQPFGPGGCNPGGRESHLSSARFVSGPWCPTPSGAYTRRQLCVMAGTEDKLLVGCPFERVFLFFHGVFHLRRRRREAARMERKTRMAPLGLRAVADELYGHRYWAVLSHTTACRATRLSVDGLAQPPLAASDLDLSGAVTVQEA
ncbi:hypothetical protein C8T65DRAFT_693927 [Cerioporus squamosus]|nr:hypothetical protein C8T65DRAFT_693927 [Cerioporus squamosus]